MAASNSPSVYQFKIVLKYLGPQIWYRIQVPDNFTFFELHVAIQDLFKWSGNHLHKFEMKPKRNILQDLLNGNYELDQYIGIPDRGLADFYNILPERETRISDQFSLTLTNKNKCLYVYDFGSEWRHDITLEKILIAEPDVKYPICIDGRRLTSPEEYPSEDGVEGVETPFSNNDIIFRDPEVVWRTESFQEF